MKVYIVRPEENDRPVPLVEFDSPYAIYNKAKEECRIEIKNRPYTFKAILEGRKCFLLSSLDEEFVGYIPDIFAASKEE